MLADYDCLALFKKILKMYIHSRIQAKDLAYSRLPKIQQVWPYTLQLLIQKYHRFNQ